MVVRSNGTKLKWVCFLILLAVNISVFCIWVPARLQISEKYIHLNEIWDRCEKVIFAIMDAALNFYFIYVVKQRLVANGLQNYIQFHPLVYLLKLHIEMNMADLIGKVVRASNTNQDHDYSSRSRTNGTSRQHPSRFGATIASTHHRTHIELGEEDEYELKEREKIEGIKKTIVTQVTRSGPSDNDDDSHEEIDDREISESSSTKQLHQRQYSVE
ncbi:hypothetical protein CEP54_014524 [Fusarium duplospermum]|uniref:Uncharacterized protein n=1 Tax=Fusarium duplospermum TaxID=1325734 RepID=A0A428NVK3_9HYPO|nr:hypothetical protein CEP54_014524 [Fusarium duplospermum]